MVTCSKDIEETVPFEMENLRSNAAVALETPWDEPRSRLLKTSPSMDELQEQVTLSEQSCDKVSKEDQELACDYLTIQWNKWCQTRTNEEIEEASSTLFSKRGLQKAIKEDNTKNEEGPVPKEKLDASPGIKKGDKRAYFTGLLSKVLTEKPAFTPGSEVVELESKPAFTPGSKVLELEIKPEMLQNPTFGQLSLLAFIIKSESTAPPSPVLSTCKGTSPKRTRPGSYVLEVENAEQDDDDTALEESSGTIDVGDMPTKPTKRRRLTFKQMPPKCKKGVLPTKANTAVSKEKQVGHVCMEQESSQETAVAPTKPRFRHVLLGNACAFSEADQIYASAFEHPDYSTDTQTDGVLSSVEMEFAWLCEESLHCLEGKDVCWSFIYKHASSALRVRLHQGADCLVRPEVAKDTRLKRDIIRTRLQCGYRRPAMKETIAHHRLALRQGITVEKLREKMNVQKKKFAPTKKAMAAPTKKQAAAKKAATATAKNQVPRVPVKKPLSQLKPAIRPQDAKVNGKAKTAEPQVTSSKVLNQMEEEIAWLVEESILQNAFDGIDHKYILDNASPPLRTAIQHHSRRWLPRLVRSAVKYEFELQKLRAKQLLYTGYRRPETRAVLPAGRVTSSEYKEQQTHRET